MITSKVFGLQNSSCRPKFSHASFRHTFIRPWMCIKCRMSYVRVSPFMNYVLWYLLTYASTYTYVQVIFPSYAKTYQIKLKRPKSSKSMFQTSYVHWNPVCMCCRLIGLYARKYTLQNNMEINQEERTIYKCIVSNIRQVVVSPPGCPPQKKGACRKTNWKSDHVPAPVHKYMNAYAFFH